VDVNLINPFILAFNHVMKQVGFSEIKSGAMSAKSKDITSSGVILMVGFVGQLQGNIVYVIDAESAKKIASTMMMGMPVNELDSMACSSLSELSNMLSAHAATHLSAMGYVVDISPPGLFQGENITMTMSSNKVLCILFYADGIPIELNITIS